LSLPFHVRERRDALVEGLAGGEFEVLQVAPARVRGATEDEHALLLPVEERLGSRDRGTGSQ